MQEFVADESNDRITFPRNLVSLRTEVIQNVSQRQELQIPLFQKLLGQLEDFSVGPHAIALLIGTKSSGKSTLLNLFKNTSDNCYFLHHQHGRFDFTKSIHDFLDYDVEQDDDSPIFEQITGVYQEGPNAYNLLIDDADLLSLEEFESIVDFLNNNSDHKIKVVLAGDDSLLRRFEKLIERDSTLLDFTTLHINPLSLQETKKYLSHAFSDSMNRPKELLTTKNLEKIYTLSMGYPGRINRVASQIVAEITGTSVPVRKKKSSSVDRLISGSILLLLLAIGVQIYSFAQNERFAIKKTPPVVIKQVPIDPKAVEPSSYIASIENLPEEQLMPSLVNSDELQLPEPDVHSR